VNCVTWTRDGRQAVTGDNFGQVVRFTSTDSAMMQTLQVGGGVGGGNEVGWGAAASKSLQDRG